MKNLFSKLFKLKTKQQLVIQEWEPWEVKAARFDGMHNHIRKEVFGNVIDARTH